MAIAEKLSAEPPKERYDRIVMDEKIENREQHLKHLQGLVKRTVVLDEQADQLFARFQAAPVGRRKKFLDQLKAVERKIEAVFPQFFFKPKIIDDIIAVARNVHGKFDITLRRS